MQMKNGTVLQKTTRENKKKAKAANKNRGSSAALYRVDDMNFELPLDAAKRWMSNAEF